MNDWALKLGRTFAVIVILTTTSRIQAQSTAQVAAEAAGGAGLEEIVVTATRREETLGHVAASVVALSGEQLDMRGLKSIDDITLFTPGVTFTHTSGGDGGGQNLTQIAIRGIQSSVGAATTGIYIDDTPIQTRQLGTSSTNAYPQVFDLERVEVLRGPQGTLFGAGSEGGAVRFITPQPSLSQYSGYARSELAFTDGGAPSYEVGLAGGGPLIDNEVGFRASAWFRRDGGWIDRVDPTTLQILDRNSNSQDSAQARLAFTWMPIDNLHITPSLLYQDLSYQDTSLYWEQLSNPSDNSFLNGRVLAQPSTDRLTLPALAVDDDLGFATLLSNTSFFNRRATGIKDYTNWIRSTLGIAPLPTIPGENAPVDMEDTQNDITQELRLRSKSDGRLNWVVGLFYSHAKQYNVENYIDTYFNQEVMGATAGAPFCPPAGCNTEQLFGVPLFNGTSVFYGAEDTLDVQYAAYTQVDFNATEKLKLTVGVRAADEEYTNSTYTAGPFAGGENKSGGKQVEHPITPKYGISYQADSNDLLYASAAKGFRPGGANIIVSSTCASDLAGLGLQQVPPSYNSDHVWSYEIGDKSTVANGRLQLNASLFWIKWEQIQQNIVLPTCGSTFTGNLGTAVSKGFDLQAQFRPIDPWLVQLNGGFTDAEYTETVHGGANAIIAEQGESILGISKWSGTLSSQYDFKIGDLKSYGRADYEFIGTGAPQDPRVYGYDPALYPTPQETKRLSLRLGTLINDWNISLFVDNVTNDEPVLSRGHDTLSSPIFTAYTYRPRTIGLTAIYRY